jgi:hypothetical protein
MGGPFTVAGGKSAMVVTYDNLREIIFQAPSASRWAHSGELVIGPAMGDEQPAEASSFRECAAVTAINRQIRGRTTLTVLNAGVVPISPRRFGT